MTQSQTLGDILQSALDRAHDMEARNKEAREESPRLVTIPDNFNDGLESPNRLPLVAMSQSRGLGELAHMCFSPAQARNLATRLLIAADAAEAGTRVELLDSENRFQNNG